MKVIEKGTFTWPHLFYPSREAAPHPPESLAHLHPHSLLTSTHLTATDATAAMTATEQNAVNKTWDLSLYELHRMPQEAITDNTEIAVSPRSLHSELMCPICLDMLKNTMTTKECLHRFCQVGMVGRGSMAGQGGSGWGSMAGQGVVVRAVW